MNVTDCSIKLCSENTKHGRVLCGTCHSHNDEGSCGVEVESNDDEL